MEGQRKPFWFTLLDPNVFITIIFSIGIALILTGIVHWGTQLLDRYFPWVVNANKRLALQLLFCALMPIAIDLALVQYFFWLFRYDFEKSNYITTEFPLVKLLIYGLNVWYYLLYLRSQKTEVNLLKNTDVEVKEIDHDNKELDPVLTQVPLLAFHGSVGINNRLFHVRDLNCFKRESNTGTAFLKDNTLWFIDFKTDELEEKLNPKDFFKINRNVIIGFDTIETYKNEGKGGRIILKSGIAFDGSLSITRIRYSKFKIAFKEFIESQ